MCFEAVGHLEVLLRNAVDAQLSRYAGEKECGIPWFLLPSIAGDHVSNSVESVRVRLRPLAMETRDQIVAGLSFGFWSGLLGPKYEDLWRACLRHAFPNSSGRRKDVAVAVDAIRKLRNKLAHHDSMVNVDVPFELRRIVAVAGYVDEDAAKWLSRMSQAMSVYGQKPVVASDTVVVAAREAWPLYLSSGAYVCQAGRAFRPVTRVAFYADREIKPAVPRILHRRDHVEWSEDAAKRLLGSSDRLERKISSVITLSREAGWQDGTYQVLLLSRPGDPAHRELPSSLPHSGVGKGSAFTQRQRYVSLHQLETAVSTDGL